VERNGAEFKSLLCLSELYGDQEIVANGFCGTEWNKKSRRVKITFPGGLCIDARDLVAQDFCNNKKKEKNKNCYLAASSKPFKVSLAIFNTQSSS